MGDTGGAGPRYLFSRATKERGRTQFEGLGSQYRLYNTQFYSIEAFFNVTRMYGLSANERFVGPPTNDFMTSEMRAML